MRTGLHRNRLRHAGGAAPQEFNALFQHFFRDGGELAWRTPASLWETEDSLHLELDAPGVNKEDVEITFDKGILQVNLERKAPEAERTHIHNERRFGKVSRSVSLPETVDPESIQAELTNGVLHVSIAKRPEAQPKRIDVKVS